MAWRSRDGEYLLESMMHVVPAGQSGQPLELDDGTRVDVCFEYYLVTAAGELIKLYDGPRTYSYEDELWTTNVHVVLRQKLHDVNVCDRFGHRYVSDYVLLENLEEVQEQELPFNPTSVLTSRRAR